MGWGGGMLRGCGVEQNRVAQNYNLQDLSVGDNLHP